MNLEDKLAKFNIPLPQFLINETGRTRFNNEGKKQADGKYWIIIRDGVHIFGDFSQSQKALGTWHPDMDRNSNSYKSVKQYNKTTIEESKLSPEKALFIFNKCEKPSLNHPYLLRKKISNSYNIKGYKNSLVIPMYNIDNKIVGLQHIHEDGRKQFIKGSVIVASFYKFDGGNSHSNKILLCEGFATAASLYESTGITTVCAFSANNLVNVAKLLRNQYKDSQIIVCADRDLAGVHFANKTKQNVENIKVILPKLETIKKCDFNDVYVNCGKEEIIKIFRNSGVLVQDCIKTQDIVVNDIYRKEEIMSEEQNNNKETWNENGWAMVYIPKSCIRKSIQDGSSQIDFPGNKSGEAKMFFVSSNHVFEKTKEGEPIKNNKIGIAVNKNFSYGLFERSISDVGEVKVESSKVRGDILRNELIQGLLKEKEALEHKANTNEIAR